MGFEKIGILGLGLMGGSIFKRLQGAVTGADLLERLEEIDLLILAVPISSILEIGQKIAGLKLTRPLVVLDIGSVKGDIAAQFEVLSEGTLEFVATHPMAGKHESGFAHSDPLLFEGASWIVTPHAKNREETLKGVEELIRFLGAKPSRMEAAVHDRRAAQVSHVPYLISKAYLEFISANAHESLEMAGPGFQSFTRLALDNPALHAEIGQKNRANIKNTLKKFIQFLEENEET